MIKFTLLLFILFVEVLHSTTIVGAGSAVGGPFIIQAGFVYEHIETDINVGFTSTSSRSGEDAIVDAKLDFAITQIIATDEHYDENPGLEQFPLAATAIVPTYNHINFTDIELNMGRKTLARIFSGNITFWDHAEILAENPGNEELLQHTPIHVYVRGDEAGETEIFTTALSLFDQDFNATIGHGLAVNWPVSHNKVQGVSDILGSVITTEGSVGYCSEAFASNTDLRVMTLRNRAGTLVRPTQKAITQALLELGGVLESHRVAHLEDPRSEGAWPISSFIYTMFRASWTTETMRPEATCDSINKTLEFLLWLYTSDTVNVLAKHNFFVMIPKVMSEFVTEELVKTKCNGEYLINGDFGKNVIKVGYAEGFHKYLTYLEASYEHLEHNVLVSFEDHAAYSTKVFEQFNTEHSDIAFVYKQNDEHVIGEGQESLDANEFPLYYSSILALYNFPFEHDRLDLSVDQISDIFTGRIKLWSEISDKFPAEPILLVVSDHDSEAVSFTTRCLRRNTGSFDYAESTKWDIPTLKARGLNVKVEHSDAQIEYVIAREPWSFAIVGNKGIVSSSEVSHSDASVQIGADLIASVNGIFPTLENIQNCAVDTAEKDHSNISWGVQTSLTKSDKGNCYPLSETVYAVVRNWKSFEKEGKCDHARDVWNFVAWLLGRPRDLEARHHREIMGETEHPDSFDIEELSHNFGFSVISKDVRDALLLRIEQATCGEDSLLEQFVPNVFSFSDSFIVPSLTFSGIGIGFCLIAFIFIIYWRKLSILKKNSVPCLLLILSGLSMQYSTLFLSVVSVPSVASCSLFWWCLNLGLTIANGTLFLKAWRIYKIFCVDGKVKGVKITDGTLLKYAGLLVAGNVVLLTTQQISAPISPIVQEAGCYNEQRTCHIGGPLTPVVLTYQIVILISLSVVAYKGRKLPSDYSESKWISLSVCNTIVTLFLGIAMLSMLGEGAIEARALLFNFMIFWITTFTITTIYIPKMYGISWLKNRTESSGVTSGTKKRRRATRKDGRSTMITGSTYATKNYRATNMSTVGDDESDLEKVVVKGVYTADERTDKEGTQPTTQDSVDMSEDVKINL